MHCTGTECIRLPRRERFKNDFHVTKASKCLSQLFGYTLSSISTNLSIN